uniref:FMN hydroxy acid dehydrogenase domain-containing protein n=1 Tax=Parascaris equorum TaxID=6256 RepID=A0A914RAQ8_PAREQ
MKQTEIGESAFGSYVQQLFDDSLTFDDLEWLIRESRLPIIVKGIMRAEDADVAIKYGVKGIIVSNHGGRQLDFTPATVNIFSSSSHSQTLSYNSAVLSGIVFLDGGVRNGGDIFKAIALGAECVFVGRPILWGLTLAVSISQYAVFSIFERIFPLRAPHPLTSPLLYALLHSRKIIKASVSHL